MKYDYLVVGSGLYGAIFAHEAKVHGKSVLVVDKRPNIAGNIYTENIEGINVHKYGAHIFHTNNKKVWNYITRFAEFNRFTNSPVANYKGELYSLPFNMYTFNKMWGVVTPEEAAAKIEEQRREITHEPQNLEEQAISLVGRDIYEKLIKGYTEKQWGRDCKDLPAFIIKRLPVRLTFDNNYFNALYQGIPIGGYTKMIANLLDGIEGFHFHTLCEQNSDDLLTTWKAFEAKFSKYFKQLKWLNLGGGHHITRSDYDVEALIDLVKYIRATYHVEVYLEPGEAVALNAGYLVTEVLDIVHNGLDILILDASAACHMPDVLEMPYRPPLRGGYEADEKQYKYRLSSMTCLAGDVIGDYSFDKNIKVGDKLIFEDMAIYSMVKNNTFNGIPLPDIVLLHKDGTTELVRRFGYEDFKGRLS